MKSQTKFIAKLTTLDSIFVFDFSFCTATSTPSTHKDSFPLRTGTISAHSNLHLKQNSFFVVITNFHTECDEYADFAYDKSYILNPHGNATVNKILNCALTSVGLILDGVDAKRREFPHMVCYRVYFREFSSKKYSLNW